MKAPKWIPTILRPKRTPKTCNNCEYKTLKWDHTSFAHLCCRLCLTSGQALPYHVPIKQKKEGTLK